MSTPFLGQIAMFGGGFAINGWAFCNGQLLNISQNTALYSLLGTTYGGDGQNTFGLPDLQCRLPVHQGQGTGLSPYVLGQKAGVTDVTLTVSTMPAHAHILNATQTAANATAIGGSVLPGQPTANTFPFFYASQGQRQPALNLLNMAAGTVGNAGSSLPHSNMMPSLCITFIIALVGIYPSRS
jgi:microcystin-dependent protein